MNILFTICGRDGSKGFKNKNLKNMNGVPLVYYTLSVIKLYQNIHPENSIMVAINTDSRELLEIICSQNMVSDIRTVKRKEELAGDNAPKVEVVKDTYLNCREYGDFQVIVDLDITSPMRRVEDVERAIDTLLEKQEYDLVFSVVPARRSPYFNMVEKKGGCYGKLCPSIYTARQQAPKSYELNASIYAYRPCFLEHTIRKSILDYNCGIIEMKDYLVLDIDTEEDFTQMSMLMKYFQGQDTELDKVITAAEELQNGLMKI